VRLHIILSVNPTLQERPSANLSIRVGGKLWTHYVLMLAIIVLIHLAEREQEPHTAPYDGNVLS
jgi:hypothetical protein